MTCGESGKGVLAKREPLIEAARALRRKETTAEAMLWEALRDRKLGGLKFRRQQPAVSFVLDFYCAELQLVIELDGGIHDVQAEQDAARTEILKQHGYRVLRFRNEEVFNDLHAVSMRILSFLRSR